MLGNAKAFSSYSVHDLAVARRFYVDTLGILVKERPEGLELHPPGGTTVFLYPKRDHDAATYTVLNFRVPDVERAVKDLSEAGIRFEQYDLPGIRTDARGIARMGERSMAWFRDPSGNILSVVSD
jgi:catechol 2,3-dioxygenase-like lactoylglutathione lyase family enzyme